MIKVPSWVAGWSVKSLVAFVSTTTLAMATNETVAKAADEKTEAGKAVATDAAVGTAAPDGIVAKTSGDDVQVDSGTPVTTPPIPVIDVDEGGTYKYVLCKLLGAAPNIKGVTNGMHIVRGHQWANYHADLVEEVESYIERRGIGMLLEVNGGGRIAFNRDRQSIMVYGYSMGYGRANHSITCELLKRQFPSYTIDWQNTGY